MWMRRLIRRSRAAKLIQRIVRGFLGRCIARDALLKHCQEEWQRILEERERIKQRHENKPMQRGNDQFDYCIGTSKRLAVYGNIPAQMERNRVLFAGE